MGRENRDGERYVNFISCILSKAAVDMLSLANAPAYLMNDAARRTSPVRSSMSARSWITFSAQRSFSELSAPVNRCARSSLRCPFDTDSNACYTEKRPLVLCDAPENQHIVDNGGSLILRSEETRIGWGRCCSSYCIVLIILSTRTGRSKPSLPPVCLCWQH